jgi:hypothetical protein
MSSKKPATTKQETKKDEEVIPTPKKEFKAERNFFFAGKNWAKGETIDLPVKDIEFLLSKGVIL